MTDNPITQQPQEPQAAEDTTSMPAEELLDPVPAAPAPQEPTAADIHRRLAEEFIDLGEEFPALQHPDQLPDTVLDTAVRKGIPLLDAYLRFRWQEEKRTAAAAQQQQDAARRSAGSLQQGAEEPRPGQNAFLRAFRAALR